MKIKAISLIIVSILLSNNLALADCAPALDLKVGDKVTDCDRVGVRKDVIEKMNKDLVTGDFDKQIADEQKRVIELKDLRIAESDKQGSLWKTEADRERDAYDKERNHGDTKFWIGIGLGAFTILAGAWAVKQVAK